MNNSPATTRTATTAAKWTDAAAALADILEAENEALLATDLAAAARLLPAKRIALERIEFAHPCGPKAELRNAATRLDRLAAENRTLLAHGIGIQSQVMAIIANAARAATLSGYGRSGKSASGGGAYALSAKA